MSKVLVLFVFHILNERVEQFIQNSIFYDENVDFIVISNDKNAVFTVPNYVKTLFRDNNGFDFGGWSDALLTNDVYKNYDKFIFVNSSVIGPFIQEGYPGKWTDIYLNELNENVKLFGSTINTCMNPYKAHVQSYIFAMENPTLEYLIVQGIFSNQYTHTLDDTVWNKEVLMSRKIIENNWNIGSLLPQYHNVDFTFRTKHPHEYNIQFYEDLMFPHFRNVLWNEYQLVFIKGNRQINVDE
jgi:hypothetical protein